MRRLRLLLLFAVGGCAPATLPFTWSPPPPADLRGLADKYPHADAVVVRREERIAFNWDDSAPATQEQRHDVIAILADGGNRWAEVAVPVGDGRLEFLHARTIDPDGRIQEVTPEEVQTATAHSGGRVAGVDASIKVFRLPGVRVGSVVEYAYGIANDRRLLAAQRIMSAPIPIAHYHAEIAARGNVQLAIRVYNTQETQGTYKQVDRHLVHINQDDIPAKLSEPFAPAPLVTEPYWAVGVTQIAIGTPRGPMLVGVYDSWSHALANLAWRMYEGADNATPSAFTPKLDGCTRPRCIVERALALVNARTDLSRFAAGEGRPLKDVLASRTATSVEKTLLLRRVLEAAGVRASIVFLARNLNAEFDPKFPSTERFDHVILRVDRQAELDEPFFVDPSCEACEVGELPPWSSDRQAIVVGKPTLTGVQREAAIEIVRIGASTHPTNVHRQLIDVAIDASGNLSGRISDELRGMTAVDFRIVTRGWSDERWRRELEDDLHVRAKTAVLRAHRPASWEKIEALLTFSADFAVPSYSASDGGRQILPLSFLHMAWDRDFGDEPRRHDVLVREAERAEETIVFHLPSGWTASELPRSGVWHSEALDAAVNVSSAPGTVTIRRIVQTRVGHWGPQEFDEVAKVARELSAVRQAAFAIAPAASSANAAPGLVR